MARITFDVQHRFDQDARTVWDDLVDWKSHENWIPMTRVKDGDGAPTDVGHEFTAWTGPGPLSLEDRMRVSKCDWDEANSSGDCEVEKLGPVLRGRAGFTVVPDGVGSRLDWFEDVTVRFVPQFLAPVVGKLGALGFKQGMKGLSTHLAAR
ncbi:MAG: SRPBCC family protein [Ilumatobacter sp.]|uniref:SRPBCC family protein n=1 Tax=Ilumatobacter sp. TaxID=1967498 RepID=UPI003299EEBD